jgi:uncharacterized protein YciI
MRLAILLSLLMSGAAQTAPAQPGTELYQIVFLKPDPARKPITKEEAERIQTAHMANIHEMADRDLLIAAGPFGDKVVTVSGIFVFQNISLAEARTIAAGDPTVTAHRNLVEVYSWRGPQGLGQEYKRLHAADPKTPEGMGIQPFAMLYRTNQSPGAAPEHEAYLTKLRQSGKLATSGPVPGQEPLAEILIFHRIPDSEAEELVKADPAVANGSYRVELHRWWCAEHVLPH